jgi:hypothetical protein
LNFYEFSLSFLDLLTSGFTAGSHGKPELENEVIRKPFALWLEDKVIRNPFAEPQKNPHVPVNTHMFMHSWNTRIMDMCSTLQVICGCSHQSLIGTCNT